MSGKIKKTEQEWRKQLSDEEYRITREKGTEPAFSGEYWDCTEPGVYHCKCCGEKLFTADDKFDAGCGWPSFTQPSSEQGLIEKTDHSHGRTRTEVICPHCDAHLGHVFPDGPKDKTGLRYCINSAAIKHEDK